LNAYKAAYEEGSVLIPNQIDSGVLKVPTGLSRSLFEANRIDAFATDAMSDLKIASGHGDDVVLINRGLDITGGGYRRPDIFFPETGNIIDGTMGVKSATTPQIRDFFLGSEGTVTIVRPASRGGTYLIPRPVGQ
jgi:hypothetical protein